MAKFQRKYGVDYSKKDERDRFQVEFNEEERSLFTEGQLFIGQAKDATAIKQWAFYGLMKKIHPGKAERYFRDKLLINERRNRDRGVTVELEIKDKIHQKNIDLGGKT